MLAWVRSILASALKRAAVRLLPPALLIAGSVTSAWGALTWTGSGDVVPSDPSTWTGSTTGYVGDTSTGTLTVTRGTLTSTIADVGWGSAATGTVGIDGAATTWANRAFYIGQSGTGTLNIANGAAVGGPVGATGINPWAIVGDNFGSQGTVAVDGAGSTWYQLTSLSVGASGSGTMTITNGGAVIADGASIGSNSGSTAQSR